MKRQRKDYGSDGNINFVVLVFGFAYIKSEMTGKMSGSTSFVDIDILSTSVETNVREAKKPIVRLTARNMQKCHQILLGSMVVSIRRVVILRTSWGTDL